jgi:hypothetical protein
MMRFVNALLNLKKLLKLENSLFNTADLGKQSTNKFDTQFSVSNTADYKKINSKASKILEQVKVLLGINTHIDFVTSGELSIHQFIQYFASSVPNCNVYISTWAIKEEPARVLLSLYLSGKIKKLYGVFDYRIKTLDAKHFHLIEKAFTQYVLTKNHSKVVIIESDNLNLVIVSSANLSNNPRIETGFISTVPDSVAFHKKWMNLVLNGKTVY